MRKKLIRIFIESDGFRNLSGKRGKLGSYSYIILNLERCFFFQFFIMSKTRIPNGLLLFHQHEIDKNQKKC